MSGITLEKTHEILEKLAEYVMNELPQKSEIMTKQELENRFQEVDNRFQQLEHELVRKADKADLITVQEDLNTLKENIRMLLNGMDGMVKNLDVIKTEQAAFISGLKRLEHRVEVLEKR